MAEFGGVLAASAVMSTIFLGGWSGPFLSTQLGAVWFLLKVAFFAFIFIWIRATFPRLRIDQIMALAWKFLLPLSVINLLATTVEVFFLSDSVGVLTRMDLLIMSAINWVLAIGAIAIFGTLIRTKVRPPKPTVKIDTVRQLDPTGISEVA